MRSIVAPSLLASLLVIACSGQDGAGKPDEAKTAPAETKVEGKTEPTVPGGPVVGAPIEVDTAVPPTPIPPPEPAPPVADDDYGGEFCATIIPCYTKLEFAGSFMADVTVDIEPDGSVSAVSLTGDAPKPVKSCITDAIKNITLATYNGKPGRTRCTKSGTLVRGTQMITSDQTYEVRDPAAKKLEANAEPAEAKASPKLEAKASPKLENR